MLKCDYPPSLAGYQVQMVPASQMSGFAALLGRLGRYIVYSSLPVTNQQKVDKNKTQAFPN